MGETNCRKKDLGAKPEGKNKLARQAQAVK
jgi:hypothetical protein